MRQRLMLVLGAIVTMFIFGNLLGDTSLLLNIRSALLVLGGALISGLMAYSWKNIKELIQSLKEVFNPEEADYEGMVGQLTRLAYLRRRDGAKALEEAAAELDNRFIQKGIELVVDGYDRWEVRNIMEQELEAHLSRKDSQVGILNTLTKLAPAFGFAGTIIGLINVLSKIGDPDQIGPGMATALLTTFYGVLFANLLFLPLSKKLSEHIKAETGLLNLIMEGIVDISEEKNSRAVAHRLRSYLVLHDLIRPESDASDAAGREGGQNRFWRGLLTRGQGA